MFYEGSQKSCQSKLVQKVLAVMLRGKHGAARLSGTSVLQVAEFIANRSPNTKLPLMRVLYKPIH